MLGHCWLPNPKSVPFLLTVARTADVASIHG